MKNVNKADLIKKLSEESGYFQKDIQTLWKSLDKVVLDCFAEVDEDNQVCIQIVEGVKLSCKIVPERIRKNPRNQNDVKVGCTVKPGVKYSQVFKQKIQQNYENKKG